MNHTNNRETRKESQLHSRTFTIKNELGVHVRPATKLVKTAGRFDSNISIKKDDLEIDAKSIMGILMLAASQGTSILVTAEGSDSKKALDEMGRLIEDGFGE